MQENKSAAVALHSTAAKKKLFKELYHAKNRQGATIHDGREKLLNDILQHLPGFVQWATGAAGCSIFWTHGIYWAMHMQRFNATLFAAGVLLIAVSAHMEVKHNENV